MTSRARDTDSTEASTEVLEGILETSPVGILVFSTTPEVLRVNQRAEEILGLPGSEIRENVASRTRLDAVDTDGNPIHETEHPPSRVLFTGTPVYDVTMGVPESGAWTTSSTEAADADADDESVAQVRHEGRFVESDYRWLSVSAAPLRDSTGRMDRVVVTVDDVTEHRRREATLARQNDRLEEFASVVSHDLRNPLTVAAGYLDIARDSADSDAFDRVEDAHARMQALVDDLLTLAREGRALSETERVAIAEVARDAWATVETSAATLSVDASVEADADPDRLRTLFENLFANAVEHGTDADADSSNHASLTVSVRELEDEAGFLVCDDGPGIDEATRDRVFERGYSTDEGTGFGLAIVSEVVEAHDWAVTLGTCDEGGACFEIRF